MTDTTYANDDPLRPTEYAVNRQRSAVEGTQANLAKARQEVVVRAEAAKKALSEYEAAVREDEAAKHKAPDDACLAKCGVRFGNNNPQWGNCVKPFGHKGQHLSLIHI